MTPEEIKALEKEVKKNKRLASEQAMELHDLIEDKLPDAYGELMGIAQATFDACKAWDEANQKLLAAQSETA
ncbi:CCE_0567 family metalloprotein [Methylicorpusculum sp.]|uniref:CCE_0567 family metalloprotein n=1 Tax=Methylicorpusculum sp. TaxID=2713644 RepID=UPI00271A20E0|nr:CCE_0567 family metalloprotein [Methylicorpusculum sp.]MDO8844455.1 CCE_0567 family metalloprotein [Methylicorpusculum sp.]MDP2179064.1 CCE_0567 family metalloprotein [Methylicorpusculum sp.]MDP3529434.1 CCE_0567 family metalloprotein [Methylicorpusculum sp.]MDZ4153688.1 CCE_0567 family metalloprotein [Methylicorpusculum sp.]